MKNGCSFLFSHQMAEVSQISSSSGWSFSKKWETGFNQCQESSAGVLCCLSLTSR